MAFSASRLRSNNSKFLFSTSMAALAMGWSATAQAQQVTPGVSPNCPIVMGEAICEGDLEDGISSGPATPVFDTLTVQNANGPIAPPGYFAIGVVKDDQDIAINIADDVVINVFDDPGIAGVAQGLIAIVDGGFDLTIDSGAAITADGNGSFALGIEALVFNGDGNLSITNRGDISAFTDFESALALSARAQNATGDITIVNSGGLSATSGGMGERSLVTAGILGFHDNGGGDINITNSGAISVSATTTDTDFNGIAAGIVTNSFVGANETKIINSGTISAAGQAVHGIVGFTSNDSTTDFAIVAVENSGTLSIDGTDNYGILVQSAGTEVLSSVANVADITMANGANSNGIFALTRAQSGGASVSNEGDISGTGTLLRGIGISSFNAPPGGTYDFLLFNEGNITLDASHALGITVFATREDLTYVNVVNRGDLDLSAATNDLSNGISVNLNAVDPNAGGADGSNRAIVYNAGDISMGAGRALFLIADDITATNEGAITVANGTGILAQDFVELALTNSGSITTTGANSDGIVADASRAVDFEVLVTDTGSVATSGMASVGIRISGASDDYIEAQIQEATAATTVQKARIADQAQNAVTQFVTSSVPGNGGVAVSPGVKGTLSSHTTGNTGTFVPQAFGRVLVNGTVRSDGGAGAILGDSALSVHVEDADAVIATTGDDAPAISATTSIQLIGLDGLTLTTTGDNSALVRLNGGGQGTPGDSAAFVALRNLTASTQGDGSTAFVLDSGGGHSVANFEINNFADAGASAVISTMGDNAHGVQFVTPDGGSTFAGEVEFTQLSTAGASSLGFNLDLGGTSSASLAVLDSSVTTGGADSDAIYIGIGDGSDTQLLLRRSTVTTSGDGSDAIDIPQVANGSIGNAVILESDILTQGDDARALVFGELGGNTSSRTAFIAESSFATLGDGSTALLFGAFGNTSSNTVAIFDSSITTAGSNARGIDHALAGDGSAMEITLSELTVTTTGSTNAGAIIMEGTVDGDSAFSVDISNVVLSTQGTVSDGLLIGGGGFDSSLFGFAVGDSSISTHGDGSRGLIVEQFIAGDGSTTVGDIANVTVTTQGADAHGVWIGTSADGAMVTSSTAFLAADLDVTTQGDGARGFYFAGLTGAMTDSDFTLNVQNSTFTTAGDNAIGFELGGIAGAVTNSATVVVLANLDITTAGDGAHGLVIGPNLDDFGTSDDFAYDGITVATSGAGAHALYLRDGAQFSVTQDNGLTLDATGANAFEAYVGNGAQLAILSGALRQSGGAFADALIEGGTLSGGGALGSVTLVGGTLAPGNSIGTLTINGALTMDAASTFAVEVNNDNTSDLVTVNGSVALGGSTLDIIELAGSMFTDTNSYEYTILANDGTDAVGGTFGTIRNPFAFLDANVLYAGGDGNDVVLQLLQQLTFPEVAQTFNQSQTASVLAQFDRTAGSDSNLVYNALLQSTTEQALAAFDSTSGEIYASLLAQAVGDTLRHGQGGLARARMARGTGWGIWGGVSFSNSSIDGNGNAAEVKQDAVGFDLGIDYVGADNGWALGMAGGMRDGSLEVAGRASKADYDSWYLSAYGRYGTGGTGFTLSGALTWSQTDAAVERAITVNTLQRTALGDAEIDALTASAEVRYGWGAGGGWAFGPLASLHHGEADLSLADETGAGSLSLRAADASDQQTSFGGGLFANWQGTRGSFDLSAQYVDAANDTVGARLAFSGDASAPFTVLAPETDGAGVLGALSGNLDLGSGWTLSAEARALFGTDRDDISGSVSVGWRF